MEHFLLRHPNLVVVMINQPNQHFNSLGTLANLERLFVHDVESEMLETIGKMPLKHFGVYRINGQEDFFEFVNSANILRDHLEVFSTGTFGRNIIAIDEVLLCLLEFRKLRELRMTGLINLSANDVINILEVLIATLRDIAIIELDLVSLIPSVQNPIECNLIEGKIYVSYKTKYNDGSDYSRINVYFVKHGIAKTSPPFLHLFNRGYPRGDDPEEPQKTIYLFEEYIDQRCNVVTLAVRCMPCKDSVRFKCI